MKEQDNECLKSSGKVLCHPFWEGEEGEVAHDDPCQDLRMGRGPPLGCLSSGLGRENTAA